MPKKTSSRLLFAIAIFVVLLAMGPETRKVIRKFVVKGIANLLVILEQVGIITGNLVKQQEELGEKQEKQETHEAREKHVPLAKQHDAHIETGSSRVVSEQQGTMDMNRVVDDHQTSGRSSFQSPAAPNTTTPITTMPSS